MPGKPSSSLEEEIGLDSGRTEYTHPTTWILEGQALAF